MSALLLQDHSRQLISGFGACTSEIELATSDMTNASAITPASPSILSFIAQSSVACGAGISAIGTGGAAASINYDC